MLNNTARRSLITSLLPAAVLSALAPTLLPTRAAADQPRMQAALAALQTARQELEKATADKGGHRVKAMRLIDDAIAEVKAGIKFDRAN